MREIKLTNSTRVALVDDEDYEKVLGYAWYLLNNCGHLRAAVGTSKHQIYMQNLILPTKKGFEVDHKDRNGLNNQKENLRYATHSQNNMNKGLQFNNTSGFKGVSWNNRLGKYHAYIHINRKRIHLGFFTNKIDAALAYNSAAPKYHGEFAVLNSIPELNNAQL